jgi:ZIP family zinc transporter
LFLQNAKQNAMLQVLQKNFFSRFDTKNRVIRRFIAKTDERTCSIASISNIFGAIIFGFSFIFLMTTLGAAVVFFFRNSLKPSVSAVVFGLASGIMISASFIALLNPSLQEALQQNLNYPHWIPCLVGFTIGCITLFCLDFLTPYIIKNNDQIQGDELDTEEHQIKARKAFKLFLAVTIHNIPEGVACGLVFGNAMNQKEADKNKALTSAIGLAIGMGIQNIPEGAAVSLPIKEIDGSILKGFIYGMLSGIVEPIFALLALVLATQLQKIDPWALAFSAGAMIYVVVEELIPEAQETGYPKISIVAFVIGFVLMMVLEFA